MFIYPIKQGVRQIERWLIAAKQDNNPAVKLLHANYAVGNIDMLRQQFTDDEVMQVTGKNLGLLLRVATRLQDEALVELRRLCPHAIPDEQL